MNEPENNKRLESWIEECHDNELYAKCLREVLERFAKVAPIGAVAAAAKAMLEFNRDEWRQWQQDNQ